MQAQLAWRERFLNNGILFVAFERGGEVYLNYNKAGRWLNNSLALNIPSHYGVEAITIENPRPNASTFVCLFIKDGSQDKGTIQYTCSPINYSAEGDPVFSWAVPTVLDLATKDDINGMVAATSTSKNEFHLVLNEFADQGGSGDNSDRYATKRIDCKITQIDDLDHGIILNDLCRLDVLASYITPEQFKEPSIVAVPAPIASDPKELYIFFRDTHANQNHVGYVSLSGFVQGKSDIFLKDAQGNTRNSSDRVASYYFSPVCPEGYCEPYIYAAYKNENNNEVRFSKISLADWLIADPEGPGYKKWKHCELKEFNEANGQYEPSVFSNQGPMLVEFAHTLYLLYSNAKNDNALVYKQIDLMNIDGPVCN